MVSTLLRLRLHANVYLHCVNSLEISLILTYIIIPKFREGLYFRGKINLDDLIKFNSITISKTPSGKYYASIQGEYSHTPKEQNENKIGIDLGIKEFIITNDGLKVDNPKYLKKALKKLKY